MTIRRGLAAALAAAILATAASASDAPRVKRGLEVLQQAASAYRGISALSDTASYVVHVPGADAHSESQEFGFGPGAEAWIRMPGLYVMQTRGERLFLVDESRLDPHLEAGLGAGLQAAIDSAFGRQGAPLAPAPLLLRGSASAAERCDAFRLRLLAPLHVTDCRKVAGAGGARLEEVVLEASNGRVRARFDAARAWLSDFDVAFVPAPGQDTIRAEARFAPHPGVTPPLLATGLVERGRRATRLEDLGGETRSALHALDPDSAFFDSEGRRVRVRDLGDGIVVLEFWATWCAPCRATIPRFEEFSHWAIGQNPRVQAILVNTEEDAHDVPTLSARALRYLGNLGIARPGLLDLGGAVHRTLGGGLPLTVILGEGGRVIDVYAGFRPDLDEVLRRRIHELALDSAP